MKNMIFIALLMLFAGCVPIMSYKGTVSVVKQDAATYGQAINQPWEGDTSLEATTDAKVDAALTPKE